MLRITIFHNKYCSSLTYSDIQELEDSDLKSLIKMKMKRRTFTNDDIPDYLEMMVQICNKHIQWICYPFRFHYHGHLLL